MCRVEEEDDDGDRRVSWWSTGAGDISELAVFAVGNALK